MKTILLSVLQSQVRDRKVALGMQDAPAETEALRNKGARRTPAKRELLRRAERRAAAAGLEPVVAYY